MYAQKIKDFLIKKNLLNRRSRVKSTHSLVSMCAGSIRASAGHGAAVSPPQSEIHITQVSGMVLLGYVGSATTSKVAELFFEGSGPFNS